MAADQEGDRDAEAAQAPQRRPPLRGQARILPPLLSISALFCSACLLTYRVGRIGRKKREGSFGSLRAGADDDKQAKKSATVCR
jgi:hypothetical protein